jgi:phage baseplate assembly protein gpV
MALWGNSTTDESRPKWLRANDNPGNDLNKCFADERGWVLRHPNGYEEVLVAVSGLSTKLGNATIAGVYFKANTYAKGATGTVVVNYNEKVTVSNGATLAVTGSVSGITTATAAAQTGVQQAEFTFTVPNTTQTLSIAGQTISGTIVDVGTATASDKIFVAGDVKGAGGVGIVKTISVA